MYIDIGTNTIQCSRASDAYLCIKKILEISRSYMCTRVIDFTRFYDFSVGFWNCQNSVVFVCFYFINDAGLQLALDSWEVTFR